MKQVKPIQDPGPNQSSEVILCVDISAEELPESIRELTGDHRFELIHCDTVYDAMAQLRLAAPIIALVRVDWMSTREFEFFSICSRSYPQLCIFVLGQDRAQAKIDRAIKHGATARLSAAVIAGVVGSQTANPQPVGQLAGAALSADAAGTGDDGNKSDTFDFADNEFDAESEARVYEVPADLGVESDFADDLASDSGGSIDPADADCIKGIGESSAHLPIAHSLAGGQVHFDSDQEPFPTPDVEHAGAGTPLLDDADVGGEDDDTLPVIVPWESSSRRPSRVPPTRSKPVVTENVAEDAMDDPPLLSPEELSLLLSD